MISQKLFIWLLKLAVVLVGLYLIYTGVIAQTQALKIFTPIGVVTSAIGAVLMALENVLWRWPLISSLVGAPPDIKGTWKGELNSLWIDPDTGKTPPTIEIYAVIKQTLHSVSIQMFTKESASATLTANIQEEKGAQCLWATYSNQAKLEIRLKSPIHRGSFQLKIIGSPTNCLEGDYWTDRNSRGTVKFSHKNPKLAESLETAQQLFAGSE